MKVALVIGNYDARGGGAERWTDGYARRLLGRGLEVHLVARAFNQPPDNAICHRVDTLSGWQPERVRFAMHAENFLRQQPFDIIHDMGDGWYCDLFMPHHGTRSGGFAQNTRLLPAPIRWSRQVAQRILPRYRAFRALESRQYLPRPRKCFVALSGMVRDDMCKYHRLPKESIRVIYNGVDLQRFQPAPNPETRAALRQQWGFGEETVFLLVAHNFKLKGLDALLFAFSKLCKSGAKVGLVVVGNDRISPYKRQSQWLGCARNTRFLGNQPDSVPCFQAADVYVHPTFYDPCSLVVLEALACGLPVITSRYNGVSELLTPGREGFVLSQPRDVDCLEICMHRMLDGSFRQQASFAARRLAELHSLEHNTNQLLELYERVGVSNRAA